MWLLLLNDVTVNTSDVSGSIDVVGCMDANASNSMKMLQFQVMTNMETCNVYIPHVMTFQSMDVFIQMDLVHLMKDLMLQLVNHTVD
ncbi:MAG: hypothetical protein CM15mP23_03450 [Cryomorphaceae bacterium]|nr:MAG: hypothetical protein CM15mP23_03450 [Cryomorphaceae bacterium]